MMGGWVKTLLVQDTKTILCPAQTVALYNYIYHFLHDLLVVLGKVLKADLSEVLAGVVDLDEVD